MEARSTLVRFTSKNPNHFANSFPNSLFIKNYVTLISHFEREYVYKVNPSRAQKPKNIFGAVKDNIMYVMVV